MINPTNVPDDMTQFTMCMWLKLQSEEFKRDTKKINMVEFRTNYGDVFYLRLTGGGYRGIRFYTFMYIRTATFW